MLDWLSNDQLTSYAESSQFLDAPETPAPVFAYRALKSVLFGAFGDEDDGENEKENIPLETRSTKIATKSTKSPLKSRSSTPQRPTPRRMLSPAKSILRTPGMPTPRRQNASVKFKDVKQKMINLSTIAEGPVIEDKVTSLNLNHPTITTSEPEAPAQESLKLAAKPQIPESESQPEIYYNVEEIEAYMAATEREMKKLVRYGQRMREYARLSQKENTMLKRDLDGFKKENEILRGRQGVATLTEIAGRTAGSADLFDLSPSKNDAKLITTNSPRRDQKMTTHALGGQPFSQPSTEIAEKVPEKKSSSDSIKSRKENVSVTLKHDTSSCMRRALAVDRGLASDRRLASRTQLPPDRLAAAKARLRLKSEERRKMLGTAEQAQNEDHGSSVLDWQNL